MTPAMITALANAFIMLGSNGLLTWLKIKDITTLSDDEKANVQREIELANAIDDDTIAKAEQWKKDHGFTD
jgi:hypothetical protein